MGEKTMVGIGFGFFAAVGGFILLLIVNAYSSVDRIPAGALLVLSSLLTIGAGYILIRGVVVLCGGWLPRVRFIQNDILRIVVLLLGGFFIGLVAPIFCCAIWLAGGIVGTLTRAFS